LLFYCDYSIAEDISVYFSKLHILLLSGHPATMLLTWRLKASCFC